MLSAFARPKVLRCIFEGGLEIVKQPSINANLVIIQLASRAVFNKIWHVPGPQGSGWQIFAKDKLCNGEVVRYIRKGCWVLKDSHDGKGVRCVRT